MGSPKLSAVLPSPIPSRVVSIFIPALLCAWVTWGWSSLAGGPASYEDARLEVELSADINGDGVGDRLVAAKKGGLEATDGATGSSLWTSELCPEFWGTTGPPPASVSIPLLLDANQDGLLDLIFVPRDAENQLVALDRKTGTLLWRFEASAPLCDASGHDYLVNGNDLIVADREWPRGDGEGRLVMLDPRSGRDRWSANVSFPFRLGKSSSVKAYDLYVPRIVDGPDDVRVVTVEGCLVSPYRMKSLSFCDGIGEKRLLVQQTRLVHVGVREITAISRTDGAQLWTWRWDGEGKFLDPVLVEHEGALLLYSWVGGLVPTKRAIVARLDPATGKPQWQTGLDGMRWASAWNGQPVARLTIEMADQVRIYHEGVGSGKSMKSLKIVDFSSGTVVLGEARPRGATGP